MGYIRSGFARIAITTVALLGVSCGSATPMQVAGTSSIKSPLIPTAKLAGTVTAALTAPSALALPATRTPGPSPTPNTQATSDSVFATITALAASPTYPPTSTSRPQRTPISAGPRSGENDIPPTAMFTSGGIGVLAISSQVMPGSAAALTIKAKPAARCTLNVDRSTPNTAGLDPIPGAAMHVAGRDGTAAWIWNIDASEPAGIMRLVVDCGDAGMARLQLKVVK